MPLNDTKHPSCGNLELCHDLLKQDPKVESVSHVRMCPTFISSGATTCLTVSRSLYNSLVGRYVPQDTDDISRALSCDGNEQSPLGTLLPPSGEGKKGNGDGRKTELKVPKLSVPKIGSHAREPYKSKAKYLKPQGAGARQKNDGTNASDAHKRNAEDVQLRGDIGKNGPQVMLSMCMLVDLL